MYVCLCNAVTERRIIELVDDGVTTFNEIEAATGCSTTCGECREHAELVLHQALEQTPTPLRIPLHSEYTQPA